MSLLLLLAPAATVAPPVAPQHGGPPPTIVLPAHTRASATIPLRIRLTASAEVFGDSDEDVLALLLDLL